jgi:hypothetical protein
MEASSFAHFPLYYPEQLATGLQPFYVPENYFFAKSPIDLNRHVDISGEALERKIRALWCYDSQMVLTLRDAQFAIESAPYDLPNVTGLDPHDYRDYIDRQMRRRAAQVGKKYGLEAAEHFRRTRWGGTEGAAPEGSIPEDDW